MKLTDLATSVTILSKYAKQGELDYVANSFPNGTPNNPSRLYLSVELENYIDNPVSPEDEAVLRSKGWHSEQDGLYWLLMQ